MDVPFHSSGALSRAHYAIVRKVETAVSNSSADQYLFLEIKSVEEQLAHPKLTLTKCKECLVILLYCATAVTLGFLPEDAFAFAFHHAINLAETARKVEDKRIGYLFCAEIMPLDHELRLMLINTLRKDLECDEFSRICLALDNLISSPTEDVIPAVQSRLHDLLSHDNAYVRRRALFAFRALSKYNTALLDRIHKNVLKRLMDSDISVVQAALITAREMSTDSSICARVNDVLAAESAYINDENQDIILSILKTLRSFKLSNSNIPLIFRILKQLSVQERPGSHCKALILEIFFLYTQLDLPVFLSTEKSQKILAVQCIRHFLTSRSPNDVHLFVSCLECVHVSAWAGTTPDNPAVLDGLEFERIMQLLNHVDELPRKKTLRIIKRIDSSILDGHMAALLKKGTTDPVTLDVILSRILELILVQCEEDGGEYAREVLKILKQVDDTFPEPRVFKGVIEAVLTNIRIPSTSDFLSSCSTHFITVLSESNVHLGPTALIIATALATEFSGSVSTSPLQVLSGLGARVKVCPAIVQEPCIIAMLRVRAECEEVPSDAIEAITTLSQTARRSIRLRCTEFLEFSQDKASLLRIIREAESPSLPDFLAALQRHKKEISSTFGASTPEFSRTSSRASGQASSSLRYTAYATPEAIPSLRTRGSSNSQQNIFGSPSRSLSSHTDASNLSTSPLMTAGHLALAEGIEELRVQSPPKPLLEPPTKSKKFDDLISRTDLINLESPFEEEPQLLETSEILANKHNFEDEWNRLNNGCDLRGWCKTSIDTLTRRLQRVDRHHLRVISSDVSPFIGELKILMIPNGNADMVKYGTLQSIAFRLRESDDDSCLWRLRCSDDGVGAHLEGILNA